MSPLQPAYQVPMNFDRIHAGGSSAHCAVGPVGADSGPGVGGSRDAIARSALETTTAVTRAAIGRAGPTSRSRSGRRATGAFTRFLPVGSPRELLLSRRRSRPARHAAILAALDKRGLKAIFFVTGWRLLGQRPEDIARRDLVRKIAAHGHLVANHTMNHHDLCQNPTEQAAEIDANTELIAQTTGVRPLLFRSPYGAFCRAWRRR